MAASERSIELIADGLQRIADAFEQYVKLEQQRFEKKYPVRTVTPVTVSIAKYTREEEEKPEEKGDLFPGAKGEEELELYGRREQRLREQARQPRPKKRSSS